MNDTEERFRLMMIRGRSGDEQSYRVLLRELSPYLRGYFRRRLVRLPDEVEDLIQETLLAIHNQRHTYDDGHPLTPWVHAIARYKMVDMLRRRQAHDALNDPWDDEADVLADSDAEAGDARRDVAVLLAQLPERQRLPIQHVKLDGMSVAETAQATGMSESAVKVGVHRGLKALAKMMRMKP